MIPAIHLLINGIIFMFSKLIIFTACSLNDSQNFFFFYIFTSMYTILGFCTIKCKYHRHWISTGNMFTYFCCGRLCKIIFTTTYFCIQKFEIYINSRGRLTRFPVLIQLQYLSLCERHNNTTKIFIFTYFLCSKLKKNFFKKALKKTLWPLSMDDVQLPQG